MNIQPKKPIPLFFSITIVMAKIYVYNPTDDILSFTTGNASFVTFIFLIRGGRQSFTSKKKKKNMIQACGSILGPSAYAFFMA
jgi:hypothetical protein